MQASADELRSAIRDLTTDIRMSWVRCIEKHRLAPARIAVPDMVTSSELRDQAEPIEDLLALAAPEIKRLFARLMDSDYLITVASKEGINVAARCDYQLIGRMESRGLRPGAIWSEEQQGTNGVGTCLKLGKPLSVVRTDHFSDTLKELSCSVVPIFGPGMILRCVLNATTDRRTDRGSERILLSVLETSALRIENCYFSHHHADRRILRVSADDDFTDPGNEFRLALDDDGIVIGATSAFTRILGPAQNAALGCRVDAVLGLDPDRCTPKQPVWLPAQHPAQRNVFALLDEPRTGPAVPARADRRRGQGEGSGDLRESVFALSPALLGSFPKAIRLARAGLPLALRGESGSGRRAFAELLAKAAGLPGFAVFRCGLDRPGDLARVFAEGRGMIYLEDVDLLPAQLVQTVCRLSGTSGAPGGAKTCLVLGRGIAAEGDGGSPSLLAMMTVHLPAIRHYPNSGAVIERLFAEEAQAAGRADLLIAPAVLQLLKARAWPGNFHEVRLTLRHMLALCEGERIEFEHLPEGLSPNAGDGAGTGQGFAERQGFQAALALNGWNVSRTARYLDISRATLNRRIRHFDLERPRRT